MKTLNVEYKDDGKKLTTFLTSVFPELNINQVYKTMKKKDIKIKKIIDIYNEYNDLDR